MNNQNESENIFLESKNQNSRFDLQKPIFAFAFASVVAKLQGRMTNESCSEEHGKEKLVVTPK